MLNFHAQISHIDGWLTESEAKLLYDSAKQIQPENVIVEIGSWQGRSTICLGLGSKDGNGAKVYAVDPHTGSSEHRKKFGEVDTYDQFIRNIQSADITQYIETIRNTSKYAAGKIGEPVGFIFIDGAHEFKYVREDLRLWLPHVVDGGIVAIHDSWHFVGPHLASALLLLTSSEVKNPKLVDTITYFEKVPRNRFRDRMKNVAFVFYRLVAGLPGFLRLKHRGTMVTHPQSTESHSHPDQ